MPGQCSYSFTGVSLLKQCQKIPQTLYTHHIVSQFSQHTLVHVSFWIPPKPNILNNVFFVPACGEFGPSRFPLL